MGPPHVFRTGDECRITYAGKNVPGKVVLASENGRSLYLSFDEMLGGYVGEMPVLWDEPNERFLCLVQSRVVHLRPKAATL
jgi:hypothetical protein